MKKINLDREETKLLDSFERGEWRPVKSQRAERARLQRAARNTLRKTRRINIRLSEPDLAGIQTRAVEEGLPYQSFIASILHKYLSGVLIDRRKA